MNNLQKHQGKIFTKDNLPDLMEYLADYMREYPDCEEGFGLEYRTSHNEWVENEDELEDTFAYSFGFAYRPAPLTKTMYNIHTGEAVEVPINESDTISAVCKIALPAGESVEKPFL